MGTLSGGWQRTALLAAAWITEPDIMLLDAPTDYLDIEGQEWLEEELIAHNASCQLLSHDRSFLRNVGTSFWWINGRKLQGAEIPEMFLNSQLCLGVSADVGS